MFQMSEDEDFDTTQAEAYNHSPGQESQWFPLSYLAGLIHRLPSFSLNLLAINLDTRRVLRNYFRSHVNGYIGFARNGGQALAYAQATLPPRSVPESTPNSRAEFEIYYDQLLLRRRGCPLYYPGPLNDLPIQYRKTGCRIGDIGILCSDGSFDYLFNVLYPAYHPINRGRVPQGFVPAMIPREVSAGQASDAGNVLANHCMRERCITDVGFDADLIFETESEIAVLVLPGGSKFQNLLNSGCLKKYVARHAGQWYSYVAEERGRMVRNGDIRLIIGFDKAPSWGIVTRASSQKPGRFGLKRSALSGSFATAWYCPEGIGNGKSGPLNNEIDGVGHPTGSPLENQTVFIRSLNFTLAGKFSNYHDLAACQVRPSISRTEGPSTVSFQGRSSLPPASSSNQSSSSVECSQVGRQMNVVFPPVGLPVAHPSDFLNQFLLENKYPNAKIVITDDWDWISVIREDDLVFPTSRELCQRILETCKVTEENGIVTIIRSAAGIIEDSSPLQDRLPAVYEANLTDDALSSLSIHCAFSALVDSAERIPPPRCAPSTRQAITRKIEKWAKSTSINDKSEIFWLTGGAGAGKSALAQSVTEICKQESILAASFFFNSASNNGASLIPTLVFQLLEVLPGLKPVVEGCINSDQDLFSNLWDVQRVTRKLFIEPLNVLHLAKPDQVCPPLIVIDGFDECHDPKFQCKLLRIIAKAIHEVPYPFRLLIASRSEDHLVKFFDHDTALQTATVHRCNLSDDPDADCDIYHFFEEQFEEIRCTHPFRAHLPTGWPGEEALVTLVDMSSQHFIYASTAVEYIQSPKHRPEERLRIVLGLSPSAAKLDRPFSQLNFLYSSIFQTLGKHHLQELHSVLGLRRVIDDSSIAKNGFFQWQSPSGFLFFASPSNPAYRTPLHIIETLLKIRPGGVELLITPLRSLVSLDNCDVRVLHKSLFDYLLDSSRSGDFHLDLSVSHRIVTEYIVENWVSFQGYPFPEPTQLSNILAYHMKASGLDIASLIRSKANLSNSAPSASHPIGPSKFASRIRLPAYHTPNSKQIQNPVKPESSPVFSSGIHSISEVVDLLSHIPLARVPSQTEHDKRAWTVKYNPDIRPRLGMTFVQKFVHDEAGVYSVKFSPNGLYLTIGLGIGEVIIYDVISGHMVKRQQTTRAEELDSASAITSVCFSPDSRYCVIGNSRGIIMVWKTATNRIRNAFVGHSSAVTCLDHSPKGQLLVSASQDGSIRLWNMRDGFSKVLIENAFYFYSVKFTADMRYIAAATTDKMLRIWDVRTGGLVGNATAVDFALTPVAISPDGHWVLSGSRDGSTGIWDIQDGTQQCTLQGHRAAVIVVEFSPVGNHLAVGLHNGYVSLWRYEQTGH